MNASPTLILHAGGRLASREQLSQLVTPQGRTSTHFTIPHLDLVKLTADRLDRLGMKIVSEQHALSHEDKRYFGIFGLSCGNDGANASDGYELVLGLRNSHDCTFPAGLSLGSHVFICDNLAFSGEITINRRHTRYIMRDLPQLVSIATSKIVNERNKMHQRVDRYKEYQLDDLRAHDLIVRGLDAGIVGATKIEKVLREWRKPAHEDFVPRNAWSLFNDFTEVLKEYNTESVYKRSQALHGMFDAVVGLAA